MIQYYTKNNNGSMLVLTIMITGLFLVILLGAISLSLLQQKLNLQKVASAQALHIAEAGVNYYRWVLYHDNEEYCNKEACIGGPDYGPYGPYEYQDSAGDNITGYYELYITPPALNGSTIVKIKAIGWVASHPNVKRTIEVNCGIPSWSSYSTLCNADIRFGSGTEVWGPIHSNGGIRFDGLAHNVISSSQFRYDDPDHGGGYEYGVHTHIHGNPDANEQCDEATPPCDPAPQDYSDVFMAGRDFPVGSISFDLLNNYAATMYAKATSSGIVFDGEDAGTADPDSVNDYWGCISAGTCDEGFRITLQTDSTFDIRGVTGVRPVCSHPYGSSPSNSILTEEGTANNYAIPGNGIIFVKGTVWVDGQIDGDRVTILAFEEPFSGETASINIANDVMYTNYDGTDVIGLIAQHDVSVAQYSEDDLRIDAGLIAKTGRIGREYYDTCANSIRNTITVYGSLATDERYGFAWGSYLGSTGYVTRNLIYDNNLTFAPPPHFPTTGEYTFISWDEE